MASDYTGLIVIGGLAVGAIWLMNSGILNNIGGAAAAPAPAATPVAQQTGNFQEQQLVTETPGISSIVVTPEIIAIARADILEPITLCALDAHRHDDNDEGHNIDAAIKIWEQEHNQTFHTIKERNEHTHMRCQIVQFYHDIDWRVDFDDPIRQHICLNKRVIIDEDRAGRFDSPRANSAALDVAHVTTPIIQSCTKCNVNITNVSAPTISQITNSPGASVTQKPTTATTSATTQNAIAPGANTPPIPHNAPGLNGRASTTPTTATIGPARTTATTTVKSAYGRWF